MTNQDLNFLLKFNLGHLVYLNGSDRAKGPHKKNILESGRFCKYINIQTDQRLKFDHLAIFLPSRDSSRFRS